MSAEENKLRSGGRKMLWRAGIVGTIVSTLAWIMSHVLGGGPGGAGEGGGPGVGVQTALPASATTIPSEPMTVIVREDRYLVDGNEWSADQIVAAAAKRGKQSPPLKIVSEPDSRLGAERDIEAALDAAHVAYSVETQAGQ